MAKFIRSAKSGGAWTENELFAFNIIIQDVNVATFFGRPIARPTVSPVLLDNTIQPRRTISKDDRLFFQYLERATNGGDAAVHDFACHLLRMVNFDGDGRLIATKRVMPFTMCGIRVSAEVDITVMDDAEHSLMVQGCDSKHTEEPKPQLIAGAIAGFIETNRLCLHQQLQQTFPAITMAGPCPIFYKIPVTQALVDAVTTGQYLAQRTIVQRLVPPVPNPGLYRRQGMNPLENRAVVFQCLEAMRGPSDVFADQNVEDD